MAKTGASPNAIRAGKALVEITGEDAGLERALRRAQARLAAFGKGLRDTGLAIAGLGAAIAAPFAAATLVFASVGDALDKAALRTGLAVESLSALDFAAGRSGTSLGDVEKAIRKLQVNIREAQRESATMVEAFDELGVSADKLAGLRPEDQFLVIADAIKAIEDPGRRAALAVAVLGKSGASILPLILEGSDGIARLTAKAERLGLIIDRDTATSAALFEDALGDLKSQLGAVTVQIGAALGPALTEIIRLINPIVARVIEFIRANRVLVAGVAAVGAGLVALGVTIAGVGVAVSLLAFAMGGLITLGTAAATVFGAILSPVALLTAGLVAGTAAVIRYTSVGRNALMLFSVGWKTLGTEVFRVLDSIAAALGAGDIDAALAVVKASVRLVWADIKLGWSEAKAFLLNSFADFWSEAIGGTWLPAIAGISRAWSLAAANFQNAWASAVDWVAARLLEMYADIDKTFDAEAAKKILTKTGQSERAERDAELDRQLDEIDRKFADGIQRRLLIPDALKDMVDAANAESTLRTNDLDEARRQLQEAIAAANAARAVVNTVGPISLDDLEDMAVDVGARIQATGGFGGLPLARLFGGRDEGLAVARKTADNTAKTARAVERLDARLAFG